VEIEDLGSANGTFVSQPRAAGKAHAATADNNRVRVSRTGLAPGDSVFLGAAMIVVRTAAAETAPSSTSSASATPVVRSAVLQRVYDEAARAARLTLPVLILGETGAGKEVLARFVHESSGRAKKPFVALNCAAINETLAETELFGHEKGAFTGAQQARAGLFEAANGGTLFLDEIGELPLATQAKLLRTLESSEVQRVGGVKPVRVDVRFVSATNRDLQQASAQGRFRQDLFFRVNGITLHVPPLRERTSEIAELARRFLANATKVAGLKGAPEIAPETTAALERYSWPGNVRELRYVMERTLVTAGDGPVRPEHLPPSVLSAVEPASAKTDAATRERVIEALAQCDGNQTRAAEILGVSRRTLINRMIEFGLPRPRKS
jgi:DNA-binding NtrC family response regulator